jgi:site-specific DNA-methyltransferase (adenine-specific)
LIDPRHIDASLIPQRNCETVERILYPEQMSVEKTNEKTSTGYQLEVRDCVQGIKDLLADLSVDLVVTSPPYNLGIAYSNYKDNRTRLEYFDWSRLWAGQVKRVLKDQGSFFLNLGACPSNPLLPHELIVVMHELGFVLQNTFHWIKSITVETKDGSQISAGHFKPIQSPRFVNDCHEFIFHLTKHGDTPLHRLALGVPYSHKSNINRWAHTKGRDSRCRGNNWFIPYQTIVNRSKERPHPATFPTELAVNCIKIHGCRPDLVMLDPFLGIGNSALAAKQCGILRFIGFDIDREYVNVARQAVAKSLAEPACETPQNTTPARQKRPQQEPLLGLEEFI